MKLGFRALGRADLPLMHRWLNQPHVAEWWGPGPSVVDVEEEYGEYIDGTEPIRAYLVLFDGEPIGHCQWMRYRDHAGYARVLGIEDLDSANADLFIGEERFLHQGQGGWILRTFVDEVIFADPTVTGCYIDPEPGNTIAIRAYEKAGFQFVRNVRDFDGDGHDVFLMHLARP